MPLIQVDLVQGRSDEQIASLLDQIHAAVVESFEVPERDRYQIVTEHQPHRVVAQDTGLGFERSRDLVILSVTSRQRSTAAKTAFYRNVTDRLAAVGVKPTDILISVIENGDADWSFADGEAQFLTGRLA